VINGVMNAYLYLMGSTCIYRVLIMSSYGMGRALVWALVWAVSGPGPWPRPLVRLSWAYCMVGRFHFAKSLGAV